jgi:hypothetical protein
MENGPYCNVVDDHDSEMTPIEVGCNEDFFGGVFRFWGGPPKINILHVLVSKSVKSGQKGQNWPVATSKLQIDGHR